MKTGGGWKVFYFPDLDWGGLAAELGKCFDGLK